MKLYECPRKSYIKIDFDSTNTIYFFDHLDGMYSYCTEKHGNVIHLAAYADVIKVDKLEDWGEKDE